MSRPRSLPADLLQAMADLYNAGASIRMLATRYNITYGAAHYRLHRAGVTFRPRVGAPGGRGEA
jgi:hypothetical protein